MTAGLALCLQALAAGATTPRWQTLSRGPRTVLFRSQDTAAAPRMLELAETAALAVASEMGERAGLPLTVVIASSDEEFRSVTGGAIPDWGVGAADAERSLVVLKSPRIVSYPLETGTVVLHEVAHVFAGRALAGVDCPRWFDEGVAMAVAGEWRLAESAALAGAVLTGRAHTLKSLEDGFPEDAHGAALAYAESFQAVRFLMQEAGLDAPGALVREVALQRDFEAAVRRLSGRSADSFEAGFRSFLRRRFGWGTLLTGTGAAFLAATCVFLAAALAKAARARRRLAELADEEARHVPRGRPRDGSSWM